jgi:hypothetical protein
MLKRWKLYIASIATLTFLLVPAIPAAADVNVFDQACKSGGSQGSEACNVTGANPVTGTGGTLAKVSRLIAFIAGIAAVIIITIGGIMYALSGGDAGKVSAAKNTILYAAIGLVVVIFAQGIIVFVLNKV